MVLHIYVHVSELKTRCKGSTHKMWIPAASNSSIRHTFLVLAVHYSGPAHTFTTHVDLLWYSTKPTSRSCILIL